MRTELITGSTAMKHWFPDFKRAPNDLDLICEEELTTKDRQQMWVPTFQFFLEHNKDDTYLDPEFLLVTKMSHSGWDIHWEKTMGDILFLKSKGVKPNRELYHKLVKDWIKVHGRKWASLKNKDSTSFFEDNVVRKYVHDDIHDAVAVYERPLYEKLLTEGVSCSEEGFERLSFGDKILLAKEETWVTALERYLIPSDFTHGIQSAYHKSLKKLMTTMSSGYFKYFLIDNYEHLYYNKDNSYIEKFKQAEQQNKLRKYERN